MALALSIDIPLDFSPSAFQRVYILDFLKNFPCWLALFFDKCSMACWPSLRVSLCSLSSFFKVQNYRASVFDWVRQPCLRATFLT